MRIVKSILKKCAIIYYNILYKLLPINEKVILFESSVGRNYSGNPKAIYEKIITKKMDNQYICIWILENTNIYIPGNVKKIKRLGIRYFYYMAIAKVWIMDSRQPIYIKKKSSNIYIQTWHGTPLKKLGLDMNFVNMKTDKDIIKYKKNFIKDSSKWDYLISQNSYSTQVFKNAFAFDKNILEIGYPRNDCLVTFDKKQIQTLKDKLNITANKKVILYAPTWRDNKYDNKGNYEFIVPIDLDAFVSKFGEEYILLLKPHYLVADKINISKYGENIVICKADTDIQELYLIADILITDYSSVMFDYSILKKPIIFYMYDFNDYQRESREFYFDILSEAPGRIVKNNKELFEAISNIDDDFYENRISYNKFCEKYNRNDNGNASNKIIDVIIKNSI